MPSPRIVPTGILGGRPGIDGRDGANVLPTAEAVRDSIQNDAIVQTALSASIAEQVTDPAGEAAQLYATKTLLNQSILPANSAPRIPPAPVVKPMPACKAGHGWTTSGTNITTSNLNDTSKTVLGDRAVTIVTSGGGASGPATFIGPSFTAFDATNCDLRLKFSFPAGKAPSLIIPIVHSPNFANSQAPIYTLPGHAADLSGYSVQPDRLNVVDIPLAALGGNVDPANLTQVWVQFTDDGTPAEVSVYGAELIQRAPTGLFPKGVVSITADDTYATQFTKLKPALDAEGWKCTLFPIQGLIDSDPAFLTTAQINTMHDQGHEIGFHATSGTAHSRGFAASTPEQRTAELAAGRAFLSSKGWFSPSFAWPLGAHDDASEKAIANYFSVARSAFLSHIEPQYTSMPYARESVNAGSQFSQIATLLPKIVAAKGWLIITLHEVRNSGGTGNDITEAQLATMITNIRNSGAAVMPMGDVIRSLSA